MSESLLQLVRADRYREVRGLLLDVCREIYADEDQAFHDVDRFAERADMYASLRLGRCPRRHGRQRGRGDRVRLRRPAAGRLGLVECRR
ncbi:hypothetical protein [Streptomyces rimosus]|uniref:hypothetical protein n=1 Tax=Streptomyces rimosus TaxID=1927 RepID=UPI000A91D1DF|nr:hypothetical protein [Streptomyces rimosus]